MACDDTLLLMYSDHESTPSFKSHLVFCTHLTVSFHDEFVHGSGAFVLARLWLGFTVSERATGERTDARSVVKSHGNIR